LPQLIFLFTPLRPTACTLFPYTTLFRSHPWGVYAIVGLTLAYFNFRHNAPLLMSSALSPLIGDRSKGWLGTGIDSLAVFGTITKDRKSTRLNSSHVSISYAVFCLSKSNT